MNLTLCMHDMESVLREACHPSAIYRPGNLRIGLLLGVAVALSSPPGRPGAARHSQTVNKAILSERWRDDDVQKRGAAPPAGAAGAPKLNPPVEAAVVEGAPNEKLGVVGAVPGVGVVLAG